MVIYRLRCWAVVQTKTLRQKITTKINKEQETYFIIGLIISIYTRRIIWILQSSP